MTWHESLDMRLAYVLDPGPCDEHTEAREAACTCILVPLLRVDRWWKREEGSEARSSQSLMLGGRWFIP